jgi:hypothetical protein
MHRIGVVALLLCSLLVPLGQTTVAAHLQTGTNALDAPAIIPNADELADAGLDGYTLTATGIFSQADDSAFLAGLLGVDAEEIDALFDETGRISSYLGTMTLLQDPGDSSSPLDRELQITVYTFADDSGAADAYEVLTDEGNDAGAEDVEGATFGEVSELTRRSGDEGAEGLPFEELELQFQTGPLLVFASLFAYGDGAEGPPVAEIEPVGELLEARADAVLDGDAPGLTALVPLFSETEGAVPYVAYWLRDGVAVPISREIPDDTEARIENYGDATDYLSYQQQIVYGSDEYDDDFLFNNNLLTFASAEDAAVFVEETPERIEGGFNHIDLEVVEDAPALGDASVTVLRTSILNDEEWTRYQVTVAVGEVVMVAWVAQVVPDLLVPAEPLYELAEAQVACLEDGGCAGTIDVPAGIVDEIATPEEDDDDGGLPDIGIGREDDEATAEADDDDPPTGDEITYESPNYGYELTYNPQEWEVYAEDPDPDDAYDRTSLSSTTGIDGVVTVIGDPDYAPDAMGDCVADYTAGLEQSEDVSDVTLLTGEGGSDDDRAWAAYGYVLASDDGEIDAVRYIECRAFDDVTIVVLQTSTEDDYEDLSEARITLLEGLDV